MPETTSGGARETTRRNVGGRPPTPPDQRPVRLAVNLPPKLYDALSRRSIRSDESMSDIVRDLLSRDLGITF